MHRIFSPSDLVEYGVSWDSDLGSFLTTIAHSGEMRDFAEPSGDIFTNAFHVCERLMLSWTSLSMETRTIGCDLIHRILGFPEFEGYANSIPPPLNPLLDLLSSNVTSQDKLLSHMSMSTLYRIYRVFPSTRIFIRHQVGEILSQFARCPSKSQSISQILDFVCCIIQGSITPAGHVFVDLLRQILLPLHRPNTWQIWDRQEPLLGEYHKSLVSCLFATLKIRPDLLGEIFREIFHFFPPPSQANTAKDLLLYTEIESFLDLPEISSFFDERLVSLFTSRVVSALKVSTSHVTPQFFPVGKCAGYAGGFAILEKKSGH